MNRKATPCESESPRTARFEEFQWLRCADPNSTVLAKDVIRSVDVTRDLAQGIRTVLVILEAALIAKANDETPLLNDYHLGSLSRMATRAAGIIDFEAQQMHDLLEQVGERRTS